jgi:hypothetical protein
MPAVDLVADSALVRWLMVGHSATVVSWAQIREEIGDFTCEEGVISEAILIPSNKVIECVVPEEADWGVVLGQVTAVIDLGWRVTVLTPLKEMGAAHQGLRGSTACVQGWWQNEDAEMRFSRTEIA